MSDQHARAVDVARDLATAVYRACEIQRPDGLDFMQACRMRLVQIVAAAEDLGLPIEVPMETLLALGVGGRQDYIGTRVRDEDWGRVLFYAETLIYDVEADARN